MMICDIMALLGRCGLVGWSCPDEKKVLPIILYILLKPSVVAIRQTNKIPRRRRNPPKGKRFALSREVNPVSGVTV